MTDRDPTKLTLDDWISELEIDEADAPLADNAPLSVIVEGLHDTAARIAARKAAGTPGKAARAR
ncbi:MAG: hypothetical protein WCC64_01320 [Aliidongia sp.]